MQKLLTLIVLAGSAYLLTGCTTETTQAANSSNTAPANTSNAAKPVAPTAPAATMEGISTLEKSGWEAWKNHDGKVFQDLLSDRSIGLNKDGRVDKATMVKQMTDSKCDVKSYSWSNEKLTNLGNDVAVLTFKAEQDATCDGKKSPSPVNAVTVYVREGDKWKNLLYMEQPVADPKNPPKFAPAPASFKDTAGDTLTDQLMAIEKRAWDAWKNRDRAAMEAVTTKGFAVTGAEGYTDREAILKRWSEPKCEGLDYAFHDAKGMQVTPDVSLVTYTATTKGKCDSGPIPPYMWVASFDMKEGDQWKNAFYVDMPHQ